MLAPVYEPPNTVDSTNVAEFSARIVELIARYGSVVIDCSQVKLIGPSGMRVLRLASRDASVTLVNPGASMRLMAIAYGFDVDITEPVRVSRAFGMVAAKAPGVRSMTLHGPLDA
ncbi:MAG TPA: STAS domain-containing protein [Acidimicrobiia bacterium]|nr:STAS domain-containing protein [Acidimicrobiia bacterium]